MRKSRDYYVKLLKKYGLWGDESFRYSMLDRLRQDCDYCLSEFGCRNVSSLWAKDESLQIELMRALYHTFDIKPEWISLQDIALYQKKFNSSKKRRGSQ